MVNKSVKTEFANTRHGTWALSRCCVVVRGIIINDRNTKHLPTPTQHLGRPKTSSNEH